MSAKKRCAQDDEGPMATKEDVLREIADNGVSFEALTIQEMVAAPLPIVVVPFPAHRYPFDFKWRVGFPAGYVTGIHLRMELMQWMKGTGDLDVVAFVLKCGYVTSLTAITQTAICQCTSAKWTRLVDFLCVLHAVHADFSALGKELKNVLRAERAKDERLLQCKLEDLTIADVGCLIHMTYDVVDSALWNALCMSFGRLYSFLKFSPFECLSGAMKVKFGDEKFPDLFLAQHADGPERDPRIPYNSKYGVTWD